MPFANTILLLDAVAADHLRKVSSETMSSTSQADKELAAEENIFSIDIQISQWLHQGLMRVFSLLCEKCLCMILLRFFMFL